MKILFVCKGNTERSVIAESFYNKMTGTKDAGSAGILKGDPERRVDLIDYLLTEGIDIRGKPKRQVSEAMLQDYDRIIVLCEKEICPDYLQMSDNAIYWDIPNPRGKDFDFLMTVVEMIKKRLPELI